MAVVGLFTELLHALLRPSWLSVCGALLAVFLVRDFLAWYRLRHIPGPLLNSISVLPWLHRSLRGDVHDYMKELGEKYGPLVRITPNDVMFTDPDVFRKVGGAREGYIKGAGYEAVRFSSRQDHLACMRDDEKRRIRKAKLAPGYMGKGQSGFEAGIDKQLTAFIDLIECKYVSDDVDFRPIDFAHRAQFFTLDVISQIAYSEPFGFLANDKDMHNIIRIMQESIPVAGILFTIPWLAKAIYHWPLRRLLPSEDDEIGLGRMMAFAKTFVDARLAPNARPRDDILQSFIGHDLNRDELLQEVILQFVAGSDTTATAIRMTLVALISTPQAYRRLLREIDSTVASGTIPPSPGIIPDAAAKKLPYLQAVIREGLRLWPPSNGLMQKDVPLGGVTLRGHFLPAGTHMAQNMYGIGRLKSIWGEDADLFRPERWLGDDISAERLREMQGVVDLAFGYGKFLCLGKSISLMELNKVFFEILKRYDLAIVQPLEPLKVRSGAAWIATDFLLRISRRKSS